MFRYLGEKIPIPMPMFSGTVTSVDVDVDVEKSRAQAYSSMPASYIANYIYCTIANF